MTFRRCCVDRCGGDGLSFLNGLPRRSRQCVDRAAFECGPHAGTDAHDTMSTAQARDT